MLPLVKLSKTGRQNRSIKSYWCQVDVRLQKPESRALLTFSASSWKPSIVGGGSKVCPKVVFFCIARCPPPTIKVSSARLCHHQVLEGRDRGKRRSEEAELAMLVGQVRRGLSVEAVRSQARCLLRHLSATSAAQRPGWVDREEQRLGRERAAHLLCLSQGHGPLRRGQFLLTA